MKINHFFIKFELLHTIFFCKKKLKKSFTFFLKKNRQIYQTILIFRKKKTIFSFQFSHFKQFPLASQTRNTKSNKIGLIITNLKKKSLFYIFNKNYFDTILFLNILKFFFICLCKNMFFLNYQVKCTN
nr:hypothetical protein CcurKRNrm3_p068 [Cryptomonas curvata]